MITIGVDVHKATHTFVAVDGVGRKLGDKTVAATGQGHQQAQLWASTLAGDGPVLWAVEDCRTMSNRLERDLLGAGESVVRVSPHLMAAQRRIGREQGKSDPIDALAVARAAQREPDLPVAEHDPVTRELKLLTDHRDHYVAQRTSLINRVGWLLHELDPQLGVKPGALTTRVGQERVKEWLGKRSGLLVEIAGELLADITTVTERVKALTTRITDTVAPVSETVQDIVGCAALTAARILGETANITRFDSSDKYARYCGVAPVPVWSGRTAGHVRMTRSGNRQLNRAIHTIALTQARIDGTTGRTYYLKKLGEGKTKKEALRCLKRQIARQVYRALQTDRPSIEKPPEKAAA